MSCTLDETSLYRINQIETRLSWKFLRFNLLNTFKFYTILFFFVKKGEKISIWEEKTLVIRINSKKKKNHLCLPLSKEIFYQVQTREMFAKQLVFPDQTAEQHTSQHYQRARGQDSF